MKAVAAFPAPKELKLVAHAEPQLKAPTDVLLRVLEVGVCGTDKEIAQFDYGTPPAGWPYLVIGHESLSEVVGVGSGVSRVRVGDLVVASVRRPCPHAHCTACQLGRQDFCATGDFTERGIKERHGFMTELVVEDEAYLHVVPPALRAWGVLVEPLTIAEKALTQVWQVQRRLPWACPAPGGATQTEAASMTGAPQPDAMRCLSAVVLGAGPVGLLGAMALIVAGFKTFVYSREPQDGEKAQLARSFGAHYVSAETHDVAALAAEAGGVDLVYEAVGASSLAFAILQTLDPNAVFVFTGVPGRKAPIPVDTDLLMRNLVLKNQVVFGTVNADGAAFEAAIRDLQLFAERFPQAVRSLITARVPVEGYEDLLRGKAGGIKNVIKFA